MKLLQKLFKRIEQKSKIDLITELLIIETSTPDAMELFENVKSNFLFEMAKREKQSAYDCRLINSFARKQSDPNFDKPINEIFVNQ